MFVLINSLVIFSRSRLKNLQKNFKKKKVILLKEGLIKCYKDTQPLQNNRLLFRIEGHREYNWSLRIQAKIRM